MGRGLINHTVGRPFYNCRLNIFICMRNIRFNIIVLLAIFCCSSQFAYGRTRIVVKQSDDLERVFAGKRTKYIIMEDIDLGGKKVQIGEGCMLVFRGGSLANGTIVGNNTRVKAGNYEIFKRGFTRYRAYIKAGAKESTPPALIRVYHKSIIIEGSWDNKKCSMNWSGLLNDNNEDVMLAVKNYVTLHKDGTTISLPTINALGYETTYLPGNHKIDFNNSTISYPDDLSLWEDTSIALPEDATPCPLESGYGLISLCSDTKLLNITIDGKSEKRQNETIRLGVSCLVSIGNSKNLVLENVKLFNALGPGMAAQAGSKDITFKNCMFSNIGEHVLYSHQYQGYCHFVDCIFDTWDSERISVYRNGMNYILKYDPPLDLKGVSYNEIYKFDLTFNNCTFINPERKTTQGRALGGFITGSFPLVIYVTNSKFIGVAPALNPGNGSAMTETTGFPFRMIVSNCDGAPYVYPSRTNRNIITEFYDCINIPFRVVYAKRYERCLLFVDLYEDEIENITESFSNEFAEPLIIKDCEFIDRGRIVNTFHPLIHRSAIIDNSHSSGDSKPILIEKLIAVRGKHSTVEVL